MSRSNLTPKIKKRDTSEKSRKRVVIIRKKKHRDGSIDVSRERCKKGTTMSEAILTLR